MEEEQVENENENEDGHEITIDRVEMGTGWVCFQGGEKPPQPDQLAFFLNDALSTWLSRNPEFKIRTILPLVVNGNTMAFHVWFD